MSLTLVVAPSSPSLLYLNSSTAVDSVGLTFNASKPLQLPGVGPEQVFPQITLASVASQVVEVNSSRIDNLGTAVLSSVSAFTNVTMAPSDFNALVAVYPSCQAPITFINGLRSPTQPAASNSAQHLSYSYTLSDGSTYVVHTSLTLSIVQQFVFPNTADQLGNVYQPVLAITGNRSYTHLPTGTTLISSVTSINTQSTTTPPASQRFYPYAFLASSPGIYSINTAPFIDADGLSFLIQPAAPLLGMAVGQGPTSNLTRVFLTATPNSTAVVVTEAGVPEPTRAHHAAADVLPVVSTPKEFEWWRVSSGPWTGGTR